MRILLVDDNADHRELMSLALTGHDPTWQVEEVAFGEEALRRLAEEEAYDLVFLDYSLPGRNGLEVLKQIRRGEAPPPVVVVTGRGDEQVAVEAMKGGAYDYVVKGEGYLQRLPVVAQRAVEAHQLAVERKRAEEELQRLCERAQRDAEIKATLLQEVNHRVRNHLLAIIGLLYAERRYAETTDQAAYRAITQNLMNRVNGLTTVHSLLAASEWAPLLLSDLAGQVVRSSLQMLPRHKGVSVEVPPSPVRVTPDQALILALVINELTTNTVKHAVQERDTAHIAVGISLEDGDDTVRLEFRDDGPGYPEDVLQLERYRVGFDLIQKMVRQGLRGELSLHNDDGAVAVIRFKAQA